MVKRIVVGAHYGLKDWLAQRVTAVIMALYTVVFAVSLLAQRPAGYEGWHAFMSQGWLRFASFLFVIALLYHAWIGVRDIFMDYIKPTAARLTLHVVVIVLLVGYAGWAVQVLWRL
jgi:succinate dehydrogenase / fumarate reductase membrane anchor subunit